MELAEEALVLFLQARDAIGHIRSVVGFTGEGTSRTRRENEDPAISVKLDSAYVLIERYNSHSELFSRVFALRYRFIAQFGAEEAKPFDALDGVLQELLIAARVMARLVAFDDDHFATEEQRERHYAKIEQAERVYYASPLDDDPIRPKVDALVATAESFCRAIIEGKGFKKSSDTKPGTLTS